DLARDILGPVVSWPRHPVLKARFGVRGVWPLAAMTALFREPHSRAMLAGLSAHAITPLWTPATAGIALTFAVSAHHGGWPVAKGGSQAISDALVSLLKARGGDVTTGHRVRSLADVPAARAYVL